MFVIGHIQDSRIHTAIKTSPSRVVLWLNDNFIEGMYWDEFLKQNPKIVEIWEKYNPGRPIEDLYDLVPSKYAYDIINAAVMIEFSGIINARSAKGPSPKRRRIC